MNFFKNELIKRALAFVLILIFSVSFVSCSTEGKLIRNDETVGDGWKEYVLNYEKNVDYIAFYPPSEFNPASSLVSIEYYKISKGEAFDRIMSLLIDIEKYATGIGDSNELSGKIYNEDFESGYSSSCTLILNNATDNSFAVTVREDIIKVVTNNSTVYFTTEESLDVIFDEMVRLGEASGELVKLF